MLTDLDLIQQSLTEIVTKDIVNDSKSIMYEVFCHLRSEIVWQIAQCQEEIFFIKDLNAICALTLSVIASCKHCAASAPA